MSLGMKDIKDFASQAKLINGAELVDLIAQVLSISHFFSFGELLLVPTVQQLRDTEHAVALNTLELFAYGTLVDYTSSPARFFTLTDHQVLRLKLLTLVTLAYQNKQLSYTTLHKALDTTSSRELEDLVIEAVFHGLLSAKIDQRNEILRVASCSGRDVTPADIDAMLESIAAWRSKCVDLMSTLQDSSSHLSVQRVVALEEAVALQTASQSGLKEIIGRDGGMGAQGGSGGGGGGGGSSLLGGLFGGSAHGRARPKRSRGHQSVINPER